MQLHQIAKENKASYPRRKASDERQEMLNLVEIVTIVHILNNKKINYRADFISNNIYIHINTCMH